MAQTKSRTPAEGPAKRGVGKGGRGRKEAGNESKVAPLSPDADVHSVSARSSVRSQLEQDVERFLEAGGCVEEVPRDFRADPPRRPENNYGRGSI